MTSLYSFFDKYSKLTGEAQSAIAEISTVLHVKKHTDIQSIGQTCKTIFFVENGTARVYYFKNGTDITESFTFENDIIARIESLFTGRPSRKAIQVIEDTALIEIDAERLFKLYDKHPDIERLFRIICESRYVKTLDRIESIQFNSAEERYKTLIRESPEILKKVPLKYIASYLGITQVSLSRIRGK